MQLTTQTSEPTKPSDEVEEVNLKRIICFAGPKGCGKDTAARRLFARDAGRPVLNHQYRHFNFAHPLKEGMQGLFNMSLRHLEDPLLKEIPMETPPGVVPREAITWLAKAMRAAYGERYFAELWMWRIRLYRRDHDTIVCTDLRHPPELEVIGELRQLGYKVDIVYVHNSKVERLAKIGRQEGDPLWTDDSEAHHELLCANATHIIHNDGSLNDLYAAVDRIYHQVQHQEGETK